MPSKKLKGTSGEPLPKSLERRQRWIETSKDEEVLLQEIIDCTSNGESLHAWSKRKDFPFTTVRDWLARDPARNQLYEQARLARAEWHVSDIESMLTDVREGKLGAAEARVIAENKRWIASRMDPHLWGEKVQVEANVNIHQKYLEAIKGLTIEGSFEHVQDDGNREN